MYDAQQRLLGHLKKSGLRYTFGYLLKDGDEVYHEKGVDVHMAVDILVTTYENLCDRIILVSSDTDLIPAIQKAQARGKIVEYIGFSHQKSIALLTSCKESRLLTKEDIQPFISNLV